MYRLLLPASLFVLSTFAGCASTPEPAAAAPRVETRSALAGSWDGHIELPNQKLGFQAHLNEDGRGTVDIPAQGAKGLPLQVVREEGDEVELLNEIPGGNVVFKGKRDGDTLRGSFTQSGYSFPFQLQRTAASP